MSAVKEKTSENSSTNISLEVTGRFDEITVWEHDRSPDLNPFFDIMDWFEISKSVS